ncbi:sigma factor-like helix-turn-helix DNA-binding protein [Ramlibacter sp. AN1015]|uniref:helix-turn-helix transcriptional regulator n=1 Tax=Ramlibacter sp. AN1015 TaxID=3133428 RepID=UPI0030BBD192
MQLTRLNSDALCPDATLAVALLEAVGTDDFAARLLAATREALPASHCTVFALRSTGRVQAIASASAIGEVATVTAIEYMRLGFDRQDSNMRWLARRKPAAERQFWLGHQFAYEVADEEYRRVCYGETGIRERLSLLSVFPDGFRVAVSLYRNHSYADYAPRDSEWMGAQAPVIAAAVLRHAQLQAKAQVPDPGSQPAISMLSARERELVAHVMAGCTTREAAERMGVSLTTANTYRSRAFQHLGIRTHRELFVLVGQGRR